MCKRISRASQHSQNVASNFARPRFIWLTSYHNQPFECSLHPKKKHDDKSSLVEPFIKITTYPNMSCHLVT